jgi:hypothetical protein
LIFPPVIILESPERARVRSGLRCSLSDIIRTRLSGRLIGAGILLFIDGHQPIGFRKAFILYDKQINPKISTTQLAEILYMISL